MKKIVVFDTETTGKYDFRTHPLDERQPHLVQLAAAAFNEAGETRSKLSLIVFPDGWRIPNEAAAIHGIYQTTAEDFGLPLVTALSLFQQFCNGAELLVAHNSDFDVAVLETAYHRTGIVSQCPVDGRIPFFCTMKRGTGIARIPGNYGDYKWPKLAELYRCLFGEEMKGAHDALADVEACARCYFAMAKKIEQVAA